ncbi:lipid A export permease/ATP-binding protein MsbA [Undibacterium oligocarboniphilum]|uniref:Lipid A export permease/ATP-binding protein MsbA n=1 Tax=Undibacterium oligocarboniphilum TaxID=666702 RepID=A0A850QK00_9BURK|nr:lipid A export permease/ATP-binding protein MsbA [Undibacterium oligocarboniphilum]MBC3869090.1 lipid A export permease/ATP-binding protein MsbA [Undibacterium oligocarboniphilum]NVO77070.1 lipid A export permease/ATP-binding protein MsbA [Undibacterium oligocarboniphilum]
MSLINKETIAVFRRLWGAVQPYRSRIWWALLTMLGTASTEVMFPKALGYILDHGFKGDASHLALWKVPVAVIGIFLLRGICTFSTSYLMSWVSTRLLNELRAKIFDRILNVPISFYQAESSGRIINTIMFEAQQVVEMLKVSLTTLFRDSLTVMVLLAALLWRNWELTMIALILMPVMAWLVRGVSKRLRQLNQSQLDVNNELTQVIEEATRASQVIRIFGGQRYEQQRFEAKNEKLRGYSMRTTVAVASTTPLTQLAAAVAVAVVIMFAVSQAKEDATTVGHFVEFVSLMMLLLTPLKRLADLNGPMQRGMAAAESVFALIDTSAERNSGKILTHRAIGKLDFVGTSFSYPGQQQEALKDIHLNIAPGETIALVGMSGGGKTSLVNLVPRFYTPDSGEILLDGQPIQEIALSSLREQIAMVSQNVVLFDDTLAANIAYGETQPDMARILAAVQAAHLTEVVRDLPDGLNTVIGDNGSRLSGGQRQRLAIARAIYKDAPILILDEATSALDTESERAVQAALDELMQGRTTLVIAHRLSTIERASRIAVLVDGQIVEIGTHTSLLAQEGVYANLYRLQFAD